MHLWILHHLYIILYNEIVDLKGLYFDKRVFFVRILISGTRLCCFFLCDSLLFFWNRHQNTNKKIGKQNKPIVPPFIISSFARYGVLLFDCDANVAVLLPWSIYNVLTCRNQHFSKCNALVLYLRISIDLDISLFFICT